MWLLTTSLEAWNQVYHFDRFGVEEGLSSSFLSDLAIDSQGYIWIASWGGGTMRFDGVTFEPVESCGSSRYVSSIHLEKDKRIWIGAASELIRLHRRSKACDVINLEASVLDILVFDKSLVVATENGFFEIDKEEMSISRHLLEGIAVYELVKSGNEIYAGTQQGLVKITDKSWQREVVDITISEVRALSLDQQGTLWEAGMEGIKTLSTSTTVIDWPGPLALSPTFITPGSLGSLFIGTSTHGIFIWQSIDSSWQQIDESQLGFDHVTQMIFDDWGNAWIASFGGGLIRYGAQLLRWHSQETGLGGRFVRQVRPDSQSGINVLYNNGKVDRIDNRQIINFEPDWATNREYTALPVSENFSNWMATEEGILKLWREAVYQVQSDTGWQQPISSFAVMDSSRIILCTDDGMWQVSTAAPEVDSSALIFKIKRIHPGPLRHLFLDKFSNVWSWGPNNLICMSDSIYQVDLRFYERQIYPTTIAETMNGEIVIGSRDAGIFFVRRRGGEMVLEALQKSEDLPTKQIRTILIDGDQMWIGTNDGIAVGKIQPGPVFQLETWLDRSSGLMNPDINEHAGIVADNQHIYFGTSSGLLEFYPSTNAARGYGPRLSIESVLINDEEIELLDEQPLRLIGENPHFSIVSNAIDLGLPLGIKYYWRLNGHDAEWRLSSSGGHIDLWTVPYGSYNLELKAVNLKGIESNILALPLDALPPIWKRPWFTVLGIVMTLSSLYVIYRIRLKKLLRQSARKARDLEIQNNLLKLEQQALRLQMNPHFIFNALQSIQTVMREGKIAEAEVHLRKFGDLMRRLLDQSRRDSISLDDEIQSLNAYLEIERSIRSERFDFSIAIHSDVDLSFYHIPPMVIQPFVENAVKHGLPVNGIKGDIQISMKLKGRYLECTIEDNGPGIVKPKQPGHRSAGIQVTSDRLRSLSSSGGLDPVRIETLRKDERVSGTMVTLFIPIIEEEA